MPIRKSAKVNTRMGGGGGQVLYIVHDLPSKKSSLQKSLAFEFLNLTLQRQKTFGNPLNPWAELRSARQNFSQNDLGLLVESLLNKTRTHFSKNQ